MENRWHQTFLRRALVWRGCEGRLLGSGEPWGAALVVLWDLGIDTYSSQLEPSEAFSEALGCAFLDAADFLSKMSPENVASLTSAGVVLDVFLEIWLDQDQFSLCVPPEFSHQLARLQVPLTMNSYH